MKKILTMICMLTCIFTIHTFQVNAENNTNIQYDESELQSKVDFIVNSVLNVFSPDQTSSFLQAEASQIESLFKDQVGIAVDGAAFKSGLQSWNDAKERFGDLKSVSDYTYTADADKVVVTAIITGSNENAVVKMIFDKDLKITDMDTDIQYSFTGVLQKIVSDYTIAITIIIFILLIGSYILIFRLYRKDKKGNTNLIESHAEQSVAQIMDTAELVDDYELVAVISAAIAAYTGSSADGFVVRSIKRANKSNWKRS